MGMSNCDKAGTCDCSCLRQGDESCRKAKRGEGRHCCRHADGCHDDCTAPRSSSNGSGRKR